MAARECGGQFSFFIKILMVHILFLTSSNFSGPPFFLGMQSTVPTYVCTTALDEDCIQCGISGYAVQGIVGHALTAIYNH